MTARNRINGPAADERDIRHLYECKFAIEPSVTRLVEMAVEAGWGRQKVIMSLFLMAANMVEEHSQDRAQVSPVHRQ